MAASSYVLKKIVPKVLECTQKRRSGVLGGVTQMEDHLVEQWAERKSNSVPIWLYVEQIIW
jgi:hypothetical protein